MLEWQIYSSMFRLCSVMRLPACLPAYLFIHVGERYCTSSSYSVLLVSERAELQYAFGVRHIDWKLQKLCAQEQANYSMFSAQRSLSAAAVALAHIMANGKAAEHSKEKHNKSLPFSLLSLLRLVGCLGSATAAVDALNVLGRHLRMLRRRPTWHRRTCHGGGPTVERKVERKVEANRARVECNGAE